MARRRSSGVGRALVGYAATWCAVVGAALAVAMLFAGCTKPPAPPPNHPDAADASPSLVRVCDSACQVACENAAGHAESVVAGAGAPAAGACKRIADPVFTACIAAATDRDALNACDGTR